MDNWYIQTMEYYAALKTNKLSSPEKIRRKLKCISLKWKKQSQKSTYCLTSTVWFSEKVKNYGDGWSLVARGCGE